MKKINNILIITLLLLCSCKSTGNIETKALYNANIKKESIEDIINKYGPYNDKWDDKEGNKIYQYLYSKAQYNALVYIPIIEFFGSTISDNYEIILVYDKNDKFVEKRNFYNKIAASTSLTCYSGPCIKKIYNEHPIQSQ